MYTLPSNKCAYRTDLDPSDAAKLIATIQSNSAFENWRQAIIAAHGVSNIPQKINDALGRKYLELKKSPHAARKTPPKGKSAFSRPDDPTGNTYFYSYIVSLAQNRDTLNEWKETLTKTYGMKMPKKINDALTKKHLEFKQRGE